MVKTFTDYKDVIKFFFPFCLDWNHVRSHYSYTIFFNTSLVERVDPASMRYLRLIRRVTFRSKLFPAIANRNIRISSPTMRFSSFTGKWTRKKSLHLTILWCVLLCFISMSIRMSVKCMKTIFFVEWTAISSLDITYCPLPYQMSYAVNRF